MRAMSNNTSPDPFIEYLDALKACNGWSDASLAKNVGLADRQHLAKIRVGERPVPFEVKIRTWDLLGNSFSREAILGLLPETFVQRIRKSSASDS